MSFNQEFDALIAAAAVRALSEVEAGRAMAIMADGGVDADRIRALLMTPALAVDTVSAPTLAGLVREVRARVVPVPPLDADPLVDTCGTGGGAATFNVSTAGAFVVAAARGVSGVPAAQRLGVAKHGNRAVASRCGSADVLEELGVSINDSPAEAAIGMAETGFAFFFAPQYHRAFAYVMPVRRALAAEGVRTAFNLVGPLANPVSATHQLVGVFAPDRVQVFAEVLRRVGTRAALVVCGKNAAGEFVDELAVDGASEAVRLRNGVLEPITLTPDDFGLSSVDASGLVAPDRAASAALIRAVLDGTAPVAAFHAVVMNAAAALAISLELTWREAAGLATELLHSGKAASVQKRLAARNPSQTGNPVHGA